MQLNLYGFLLASLVAFISAGIQSTVGFGFALIAVPFLTLIDIHLIPGPVAFAALFLALMTARRDREGIDYHGIKWAITGRIPGTLLGILTLQMIAAGKISLLVGILVCVAVALSAVGYSVKVTARSQAIAGVISGFMGTIAAIGGPPMALLYQHRKGEHLRGTLAGYFVLGTIMTLTALTISGLMGLTDFINGALLLPGLIAGFAFSNVFRSVFDREGWLRTAVLVLAGGAGLEIVLANIF
jgi:uncharacterized protein